MSQAQSDSAFVLITLVDNHADPINNVNAQIKDGDLDFYRSSNTKGHVSYYTHSNMLEVSFTHARYESSFIKRKERFNNGDTIRIEVELVFIKALDLNPTVVTAPGVPTEVYGSKRLHVEDFEIQKNGQLVLLTYPKRLTKGSELLLYDGLEVVNSFKVPGKAQELIHDFRGNTHVVCEENVFGIHVDGPQIGISTVPKAYYLTYIAPIVDTNNTKMYFSNFNPDYPAFEYFSFDQQDSTYKKIMKIEDELMMELYRSEYKWVDVRTKLWAKTKEMETGIDAEVWVGANYFTQSIYYQELYAPMFHRNDSIFVFDYYKDKLYTYDSEGEVLDSVEIYHHYNPRKTGWQKQLIQDKVTGEVYALYDRAGYTYLGWINTNTGEVEEQVKLEYRYIDKVSIHNNFVYYVYRPFESVQKKFLYKERLPYEFGAGLTLTGDDLQINPQ